jgi:transcriptional regulator with XRE-family HTH domain
MHGNRIKILRKEIGLTQAALAKILGITQSAIAMLERDQRKISEDLAWKLSQRLGVKTEVIDGQFSVVLEDCFRCTYSKYSYELWKGIINKFDECWDSTNFIQRIIELAERADRKGVGREFQKRLREKAEETCSELGVQAEADDGTMIYSMDPWTEIDTMGITVETLENILPKGTSITLTTRQGQSTETLKATGKPSGKYPSTTGFPPGDLHRIPKVGESLTQ